VPPDAGVPPQFQGPSGVGNVVCLMAQLGRLLRRQPGAPTTTAAVLFGLYAYGILE
jgi:hypothetical protein